jgi:hypothetical protein
MAQGFADTFQAIDSADARQHMGRVGALPTAGFQPAALPASPQHRVQQALFGCTSQEARAKLTQDGVMEPAVGEFQTQSVLPVDAGADSIRCLAIR